MEDRSFHEDYNVEEDSDDDGLQASSDEDNKFDEYYLSTKEGKDILGQKNAELTSGVEDQNPDKNVSNEDIILGSEIAEGNLLYGENIDKDNEDWMARKRNKHKSTNDKNPKSDAILSCPACMVTVSLDCQRHESYKTQFRAMFVMNCEIVSDQLLRYEHKNISKKRRKKENPGKLVEYIPHDKSNETQTNAQESDITDTTASSNIVAKETVHLAGSSKQRDILYNPVKCGVCGTEIAVYDKDEIYHFFNVIESLA